MPDDEAVAEEQKPDPGIPKADENQAAIDKAELAILKEKAERLDQLDEIAKSTGRDRAETYFTDLENAAFEKMEENDKTSTSPDKKDDKAEKKDEKPVVETDVATNEALKATQRMTVQTVIELHEIKYKMAQAELPEEERSTATIEELKKMVTGAQSQLVAGLATEFGGNLFAAAAHIITIKGGVSAARKEGAASEAAKASAAANSSLETAGRVAEPKGPETPEELAAAENEKEADKIAPSEGYTYPG